MKKFPILLISIALGPLSTAQVQFSFSGYALDLPIYQKASQSLADTFGIDQHQILNISRVRLRPTLTLSPDVQVALEYEVNASYFSSSLVIPIQPLTRRQLVDLTWQPVQESHLSILHYVDRFYYKQLFSAAEVVIGRQRISWGTGRAWNPTDLFNPINPASFAKIEKDGVDAASVKFFLGRFTDLMLVVNPERHSSANIGGRFRTNIHALDCSFTGGYFDRRIVIGGDMAGNLFAAGVRAEAILSAHRSDFHSNFVKYIIGIDNQFTPELYALAEYHYNGEGSTERRAYDLPRLVAGEILNVAKNYVILQGSYLAHPLVTLSLSATSNLNDGSHLVNGMVAYSASADIFLNAGCQLTIGEDRDEYWYYPSSVYLRGEIYF